MQATCIEQKSCSYENPFAKNVDYNSRLNNVFLLCHDLHACGLSKVYSVNFVWQPLQFCNSFPTCKYQTRQHHDYHHCNITSSMSSKKNFFYLNEFVLCNFEVHTMIFLILPLFTFIVVAFNFYKSFLEVW